MFTPLGNRPIAKSAIAKSASQNQHRKISIAKSAIANRQLQITNRKIVITRHEA
jgi:hypothetical protein